MQKLLKKKNKKIGILGGTFDPPHIGHLNISKIAIKKFKLDSLLWIVTKKNPLKKEPLLNIKIRMLLSKDIVKNYKKISVEFFDKKVKSKNTFALLNYLKKRGRESELFFIIGADNFINFHKWKDWKKIPQLSKIVVFSRPKYTSKALNSIASKNLKKSDWLYIDHKKMNISSSLIRKF